MTKRTPSQEYSAALAKRNAAQEKAQEKFDNWRLDQLEKSLDDRDSIIKIESDPNLSPEQLLELFKSLRGWPRIVLGLYQAELTNITAADGPGKPSDIAYENIGKVVGLGPDRIKALCNEARRQLKEGMPAGFVVNMTAAEFEVRILRRNCARRAEENGVGFRATDF
jgi:hypothetical protein